MDMLAMHGPEYKEQESCKALESWQCQQVLLVMCQGFPCGNAVARGWQHMLSYSTTGGGAV
jgi:hypothetical protein